MICFKNELRDTWYFTLTLSYQKTSTRFSFVVYELHLPPAVDHQYTAQDCMCIYGPVLLFNYTKVKDGTKASAYNPCGVWVAHGKISILGVISPFVFCLM